MHMHQLNIQCLFCKCFTCLVSRGFNWWMSSLCSKRQYLSFYKVNQIYQCRKTCCIWYLTCPIIKQRAYIWSHSFALYDFVRMQSDVNFTYNYTNVDRNVNYTLHDKSCDENLNSKSQNGSLLLGLQSRIT